MKRLWRLAGRLAFTLTFPLIILYVHRSKRTRLLLICGDNLLVLKGWLGKDNWSLPGGGLHRNEDPAEGLLRELKEETGIELDKQQLRSLGTWRGYYWRLYVDYFGYVTEVEKLIEPNVTTIEISHAAWIPIADLNDNNTSADTLVLMRRWKQAAESVKL